MENKLEKDEKSIQLINIDNKDNPTVVRSSQVNRYFNELKNIVDAYNEFTTSQSNIGDDSTKLNEFIVGLYEKKCLG